MTDAERRKASQDAFRRYQAASRAINPHASWREFVEEDARLYDVFKADERRLMAAK